MRSPSTRTPKYPVTLISFLLSFSGIAVSLGGLSEKIIPRRPPTGQVTHNQTSQLVLDEAFAIHRKLGPGLLESVYGQILAARIAKRGLKVESQVPIPLTFEGQHFETAYRADLIVDDKLIVEIKSTEKVQDVHKKQLLTYLRLSGLKLGLLINFNQVLLKEGITRIANGALPQDGDPEPASHKVHREPQSFKT